MTKTQLTFLLRLTTLVLLTAAMSPSSARAQSGEVDLQPLKPDGEEFTVLMPKDPKPKFEESQDTYHRMTLNARLYLSASENGPLLAVASLSGIKANGAGYTGSERLNSYVDAFKNWFPQKVRGKDASAMLTLVGEKTLNGNKGREYHLVIGDMSGTARVFVTRKRFYAAVVLSPKKDDVLTEQFLSSFVLPEKPVPPPPVVATSANSATPDAGKPANNGDEAQKPEAVTDAAVAPKSGEAVEAKPGERAPVSGGVLNSKAIVLPLPEYPPIAARANAAGTVTVQILVDETGSVVNAHAIAGHPLLLAAAVAAARQARFSPTFLMGEPVKVTGVLTYNFDAH